MAEMRAARDAVGQCAVLPPKRTEPKGLRQEGGLPWLSAAKSPVTIRKISENLRKKLTPRLSLAQIGIRIAT